MSFKWGSCNASAGTVVVDGTGAVGAETGTTVAQDLAAPRASTIYNSGPAGAVLFFGWSPLGLVDGQKATPFVVSLTSIMSAVSGTDPVLAPCTAFTLSRYLTSPRQKR